VPWAQDWRVPSPRVLSAWRTSTGPGPLEHLRDKVLTEHGELPDPAAPARHADCSVDSVGLPAPPFDTADVSLPNSGSLRQFPLGEPAGYASIAVLQRLASALEKRLELA
jgi:hypothetical protein